MRLFRLLRISLRSLAATPWRNVLTSWVVAVSIACVSLSGAIGRGAQSEVLRGMETLIPELLVVRPAEVKQRASQREIRGLVKTLRLEDCEALKKLDAVRDAAPGLEAMVAVRSSEGALVTKMIGTSKAYLGVRRFVIDRGRFLDDDDDRTGRRSAVLGARVVDALFPGVDAIGEVLRIRGVPYEVVGTMKPKGVSADGADHDNVVLIPVRTALRRAQNQRFLTTVFVSARQLAALARAEREIRAVLRERHRLDEGARPDDFAIQNQLKVLDAQAETAASLGTATTRLAWIALLLGGFGILGLMLLAVRDRTPEIGLRMALGARRADVGIQFLCEATLLSVLGGLLGVGVGFVAARVVSLVTTWPTEYSLGGGAVTLTAALLLGVTCGAIPALRAARLPPVQALAQE